MSDSEDFRRIVVVVDDEPILRALIADRLRSLGFEAHPAANALEAKKLVAKVDPDAVIVDLDLGPGPNGIELIVALGAQNPELGFLLLSNFSPTPAEMKSARNVEFVSKSEILEFSHLVDALERVLQDSASASKKVGNEGSTELSTLTKKQLTVLSHLAAGMSNSEIAERQKVSIGAIEQAIHRIYLKLGISSSESSSRRVVASKMYSNHFGPTRINR